MIASAFRPSALSIIFCRCPGTNIHERIKSMSKILLGGNFYLKGRQMSND